jgi:hypothetical protein
MTATKRRFAAAMLAAVMPLAAISVATATPSLAESTCSPGRVDFNGNCVDKCNKSQVRNSSTGECQTLLAAALDKAETPAVAKLTPDQLGGAWQLANNIGAIPEASKAVGIATNIADTVVDVPVAAASASADLALTLAYLGLIPGGGGLGSGGLLRTAGATGGAAVQTLSAANDVAQVARALPSPKIGLPKLPNLKFPPHPRIIPKKFGIPHPKLGIPHPRLPRFGSSGICGPKLLFFTPCL